MLAQTLVDVRRGVAKRRKPNDNDTKAAVNEHVVATLGQNLRDGEADSAEHKDLRAKPVNLRSPLSPTGIQH